jgi:DNA-binding XRE family transcriptional regulator
MNLKEVREQTGLTLAEAAKFAGFPVKTWEAWENGERPVPPYMEHLIIEKLNQFQKR